jgi:hypothetical protein
MFMFNTNIRDLIVYPHHIDLMSFAMKEVIESVKRGYNNTKILINIDLFQISPACS